MGLLDDAIREHLELKRRHGADPGEVARAEHAALAPPFDEAAHHDDTEPAASESDLDALVPDSGQPMHVGQETAELDMQAVLEADVHEGHQGDPLGAEALGTSGAPSEGSSEDFAWEQPEDEQAYEVPEQIPGQERMPFE